jgi:hypothetical protein
MTQLEALKAIAARDGGFLRPEAVVEEARDEKSPLHGAFCWDDTKAAHLYRLDQAQRLIRKFHITVEHSGEAIEVPVFIGVSSDRENGKADNPYRLVSDIAKDADLLSVAEKDALEQLNGIRKRYSYIKRLNGIWAQINKLCS